MDPKFQGKGQESDREVSQGWRTILERLTPNSANKRKIRDQLSNYGAFHGAYGCADAQEERFNVGAALWWEDFGSDGPELYQLAIRIFSQSVSSSCLEQLWSSYAHLASKKRNRLGVKTNDLVFVSVNFRMLCKSATTKANPFTQWEMEQEAEHTTLASGEAATPSDAPAMDLDATCSHDHEATTSRVHSDESE